LTPSGPIIFIAPNSPFIPHVKKLVSIHKPEEFVKMSITIHFESYEPLVIPRISDVTFREVHNAIASYIPEGVEFDMDRVMYYDRAYRNIDSHPEERVEVDFIHAIRIENENLMEFYYEGPQHVVATWPWQMDAEGEAWLAQNRLESAEQDALYGQEDEKQEPSPAEWVAFVHAHILEHGWESFIHAERFGGITVDVVFPPSTLVPLHNENGHIMGHVFEGADDEQPTLCHAFSISKVYRTEKPELYQEFLERYE
jgi:hypothetical protein